MRERKNPAEIAAFFGGCGIPDTIWINEDVSFFRALGHYVADKKWGELANDTALHDWLMEPTGSPMSSEGLSRLALAMYHAREDLQKAFRLPEDKTAFEHWMQDGFFKEKLQTAQPAFRLISDESRINLIGFHRRENGLANVLRSVDEALKDVLPVNIVDLDPGREEIKSETFPIHSGLSICVLPPSELAKAIVRLGSDFMSARRNICYLAWETAKISPCYETLLHRFDEIWCYSEFIQQAALDLLPEMTVRVVPLFVDTPAATKYGRKDFGVSKDDYVIGFHFDYKSSIYRKNPLGLVKAFHRAFPPGGEYGHLVLYIKIHDVERDAYSLCELNEAAGEDNRIRIVVEFWEREKVYDWLSSLDLYVSLHRAEGFGYGMAEAMVRGVPSAATNYSGNLQFMTQDNSLLVDYELTPIGRGEYSTGDNQTWADPCLDDAAEKLRSAFHNRDLWQRLSRSGAETLSTYLSFGRFKENVLSNLGVEKRD